MDCRPSQEYLRNAVLTATREQLHLMLYDGAIRFCRQGIQGIEAQDWEAAFNGLSRAQKIVLELINSLNYDADRALCTRMASLYQFIYRRLVEANVQRQPGPAQEALKLLEYQRQTWVMVMERLRQGQADGSDQAAAAPSQADEGPALCGTLNLEG